MAASHAYRNTDPGRLYLFITLSGSQSLTQLGLVAFSGTLQFLPGIIATLHWPGANRKGLIAGLVIGLTVWFF